MSFSRILFVAVFIHDRPRACPLEPTCVGRPLHGFTHLRGPVECGPEGALNAWGLNELERPPSVCITGCRVASEKFAVLLDQIPVGALRPLGHEVVECPLQLLPLAAGLHLRPDQRETTGADFVSETTRYWGQLVSQKEPARYQRAVSRHVLTFLSLPHIARRAFRILSSTACLLQLRRVIEA